MAQSESRPTLLINTNIVLLIKTQCSKLSHQIIRKLTEDDDDDDTVTALLHSATDDAETIKNMHQHELTLHGKIYHNIGIE